MPPCTSALSLAVAGVTASAHAQDFYSRECWAHHPKPYADFLEYKVKERADLEAEQKKLVRM